jgi:cytochrome oxidase Cu insertion factor (SCO1/SenC/PrrC family)
MAHESNQGSSSKAVIWIVLGIVGGFTLLCAGVVAIGIMAMVSLGTSANATFKTVSSKIEPAPAKTAVPKQPSQPGIQVGTKAPEIEGEDIQGTKFKLSDYRGKVVMLDFWGNW